MKNQANYSKVKNVVDQMKKDIENDCIKSAYQCRNIKITINPEHDNIIGGYNFQVFPTDICNREILLDKSQIINFKDTLKKIKGIKKVKMSPAYNQKMLTVFAVGLDSKLLK